MEPGRITQTSCVKITGNKSGQLPLLTDADRADVKEIAATNQFDYIVVPCVQSGKEVTESKIECAQINSKLKVLAKIDTKEGVVQFE